MNWNGRLYAWLYTNDSQCSKLRADSDYMNAMSSVEAENKNYTVNQLSALKNKLLSMDNIDKKYKSPMTICCFGNT
jgi:hypothetical protein